MQSPSLLDWPALRVPVFFFLRSVLGLLLWFKEKFTIYEVRMEYLKALEESESERPVRLHKLTVRHIFQPVVTVNAVPNIAIATWVYFTPLVFIVVPIRWCILVFASHRLGQAIVIKWGRFPFRFRSEYTSPDETRWLLESLWSGGYTHFHAHHEYSGKVLDEVLGDINQEITLSAQRRVIATRTTQYA